MNYKKISIASVAVGMFAAGAAFAQNAEIATWSGFRKGAASFTFDDGAPSQVSDAAPVFDKYGYKGTFNLVYNWNPNWSGFQGMADNGHEIASHSNSHGQNMSGEEASSKQNINGKIKQKYGIITVAYPNCNVPNESAVKSNYIVGRICNGSWKGMSDEMGKDGPSNWAQTPATMTGAEGQIKSTNDFTGRMQKVIQSNGWAAFLTHGFQGKNNGNATYSPTDLGAIEGALKWAKENDKDIWVAPMGFVAMYIKERNASKIEPQDGGAANTMTFELKHSIADNISKYDYPLSIKVKTDWTKVEVTQSDAKLESKVDGGYVYFDAVPNAGKIVVKNANAAAESSSSAEPPASSSSSEPAVSSSSTTALPMQSLDGRHLAAYVDASGYITVQNAQGLNITVFNSLGNVVRTTKGIGMLQKVYTGAKGMYVVKIGNRAWTMNIK
ncbi:polysaccharide deacetylase family protein [Fibrobacter sp. UWB13]|uniref:polysaccharide deacetylase family protein n=1 Tax=Fibrobacter sp. UWB13 TaxID=1896204 RepID=UPI000A0A4610|nr:polysaccharide deacetylase family protein [Fibrobacter sp. UWB13]SMG23257.1 Polysaccharide deacetylase [Fibrobacter sp. UWB13]